MSDFENRRAGMLLGSFVCESLSLGVHWIYDPELLAKKFGYVSRYYAPRADSYHPFKVAGNQSHVGDQALILIDSLMQQGAWDPAAFMSMWAKSWPGYGDYIDRATKTVLANLQGGADPLQAASNSDELAGPARIAPLLAFLASGSQEQAIDAAVAQTRLTHASREAEEATIFLAKTSYRILYGANLIATVRELAPVWALQIVDAQLENESVVAIGNIGRACPIKAALPAVIYLILKFGGNSDKGISEQGMFEKALSENAMAGGDNCARGLALGLVLGAHYGAGAIPRHLLADLTNRSRIEAMLYLSG
ncbi:MAG: ADP-ribosylglycohydrolase [Pseudohongiellaceae bacterium]|jgi:ADP-ribosylglycohydrolase